MGASALSNKTFHFDKVFSPAADQSMIYDDVVTPLLDEVRLSGYIYVSCSDSGIDAPRLQLYDIRLRTDGYRQNLHNVWRYVRYARPSLRLSWYHTPSATLSLW